MLIRMRNHLGNIGMSFYMASSTLIGALLFVAAIPYFLDHHDGPLWMVNHTVFGVLAFLTWVVNWYYDHQALLLRLKKRGLISQSTGR